MTLATTVAASHTMRPTQPRTQWDELPHRIRRAIGSATGHIQAVEPITSGLNCGIAAVLHTSLGRVFIKGLPSDHPHVASQRREAEINPYVALIAPRLLWQIELEGWNVLGFEHLNGRHATLAPGSADLLKLADTLTRLGHIPAPDLPLRRLDDRWAGLIEDPALALLAGQHLLHTDLNPHNILISPSVGDGQARIIDWAWPTLGAAWIDSACAALWLIAEGHTPAAAESWAQTIPSWATSSPTGIDAFTTINHRLWGQIARDDPQPWKQRLHAAAQAWATHRATAVTTA